MTATTSPTSPRRRAAQTRTKKPNPVPIVIEGKGYTLRISPEQPVAELELNGRLIASLNLASGVDTLDGADDQTELSGPEIEHDKDTVTLRWRGKSALWQGKTVELHTWAEGFSYGYTLEGHGAIDRAYLLRSRLLPSPAHSVRLFTPEPNSGCVRYTGDRCTPEKSCVLCYPEKATEELKHNGPLDFMTISVGRDKYFHDGNWLFSPSPFCYAVEGEGNWLALGVAAKPGEWMFTDMEYTGGGFGFGLVYEGHVHVDGFWSSPRLVCLPAPDEYAAVNLYCDYLREQNLAPKHGRGPAHDWWKEPIFCGWGEQVSQELHIGSPGMAADWATQANYEHWLASLEAQDISPSTVVIDDKWQLTYGRNDTNTAKWPDMQGFIASQHSKDRRVLLWLNAWSGQGLPAEECMLDADGVSLRVDPGNQAFRERFTEQIRFLLQEVGADGFKIDFTHLIPRGRAPRSAGGLWGLELMRQWFELISEATKRAKQDAVLIAHAANPYLADLIDVLRLNDVAGLLDPYASILPDMGHRARIARAASPYWLLDSDNWPCSSLPQWREYLTAQATGEFGIPSLYHAERLAWGKTDQPLGEQDYGAIRTAWAQYRARLRSSHTLDSTLEPTLVEETPSTPTPRARTTDLDDLKRKVGQLIIVEIPGRRMTAETEAFIRECHPSGVVLFGSNLSGPWATAEYIADLQAVAASEGDDPLLVAMDQEGGQVAHLRYPCVEMPSNMARAAAGLDAVTDSARIMGTEMVRLGINLGLAPVVDVNTNPLNPVIGARAFSDDPEMVAACTAAAIRGMRQAGVLSMAKHFPGHGATSVDSHIGLPVVSYGWERLREIDLAPFRTAIEAGVDTMISAHVLYPGVDKSNLAATLSRALMTDLLRQELGFKGALFSDSLTMGAITGGDGATIPPAAIACIQAGIDCAMLFGSLASQRHTYETMLGAVRYGIISEERLEEAVARMTELRRRVLGPDPEAVWPDMEHQWAARRIARASITLVRDEQALLPLTSEQGGAGLGVVEFSSGRTAAVEGTRNEPLIGSSLAVLLGRELPDARFLALSSAAPNAEQALDRFLPTCERVVVATRNAALDAKQTVLLRHIAAMCTSKPLVQVALRGPYDANIEPCIGTVLLSYGDQPESVAAVVDILLGGAMPSGRLPVRLAPAEPGVAL